MRSRSVQNFRTDYEQNVTAHWQISTNFCDRDQTRVLIRSRHPRSDIPLASTEVVDRPQSPFPPHFGTGIIQQICMQTHNTIARCLPPADML